MARLLFIFACFASSVWADFTPIYSAARKPAISYEYYLNNFRMFSVDILGEQQLSKAPADIAKDVRELDISKIVVWNANELQSRFAQVRDLRFLKSNNDPNFLRRATWLFPDDGCFARAGVANSNFWSWKIPVPNKIFVFGDLVVKSDNALGGSVSWWYHVAPIVRVGSQAYVLDPAIDPKKPLPLLDWLKQMHQDIYSLNVVVCGSGTYTPYDDCETRMRGRDSQATKDEFYYLQDEWRRLIELKRNPERELGEYPPWLVN